MDRLTGKAALAALFVSFAITGCGGGGGGEAAAAPTPAPAPAPSSGEGTGTQTVGGVATPQTVSVVTAKNAD